MFPRFHRRSAFSARCLYEQRVARAWRCAAVAAAALLGGGAAFVFWPRGGREIGMAGVLFEGVPYAEAAAEQKSTAPAPLPPLRVLPPTEIPAAHAPAMARPVVLPWETPELVWESPDEQDEPFSLAEELPPLAPPPTHKEARRAAAGVSPSAAHPASAVAAAPASGTQSGASAARRTPPAYRSAPRPPYPAAMRQLRCTGSVGVRISVSAEGKPTGVEITQSAGHAEFDALTREWIMKHWSFHPATEDDRPTAATVRTRVEFRLD